MCVEKLGSSKRCLLVMMLFVVWDYNAQHVHGHVFVACRDSTFKNNPQSLCRMVVVPPKQAREQSCKNTTSPCDSSLHDAPELQGLTRWSLKPAWQGFPVDTSSRHNRPLESPACLQDFAWLRGRWTGIEHLKCCFHTFNILVF